MTEERLGVAVVGCGIIANEYTPMLAGYPELQLRGVTDLDVARAERLAGEHGVVAYHALEELLADPAVDIVVNLTNPRAHRELVERCLGAGKHVYSEKPLALVADDAFQLVKLARRKGVLT